jgi:hypothetical protein
LKNDLDGLFREAERLRPPVELWWRIAERSPLARGAARRAQGRQGWQGWEWLEVRYLKAAGVVLAAGLFALAAFGLLRNPAEPVREASAETALSAQAGPDTDLIDPELLGWQAGLGNIDLVADEAEEAL